MAFNIQKKYKSLLKSAVISVISGAIPALIIFSLCNIFIKSHRLLYLEKITMYKIRWAMPLMIGLTITLFIMTFFIGREERKNEKLWEEQDAERKHSSGITGVNEFGLIDDSREKGFLSIYGEEIVAGKDHGTLYMIFKFLSILFLCMTVPSTLVMLCMMLSVKL